MGAKLVIITLLAAIGFFNYHNLITLPVLRSLFMFMIVVCLVYARKTQLIRLRDCSFPRLPWFVFGCGLIVSIFMASFYHTQSITSSFIAQSTNIVAYGSFFVLLLLNPDPDRLIKYMFILFGLSVLVYFVNLITFPNNIFGAPIISDSSRGALRIQIPLLQVISLLVFYSINRWNLNVKDWKWLVIACCCFAMVIMSLTRQAIVLVGILGYFQLLQRFAWWKKIAVGVVLAIVGYCTLIHLPIYQEMKDVTEEQLDATASETKEDVRIGAWRYYAYEANVDIATFIFGNGTPSFGKSVWGKKLDAYTEETGFFVADVSWAAVIYLYGLVAAIALIIIILSAIFKRKSPTDYYLNYFLIFVFLRGIASGVWYYFDEIFITMIALSIVYRPVQNITSYTDTTKILLLRRIFVTK